MATADIDIMKLLVDWGWAAVGGCISLISVLVHGRISKLEKGLDKKADKDDLNALTGRHEALMSGVTTGFTDVRQQINNARVELLNAINSASKH